MKSIGAMVKQLGALVGTDDFTEWEEDFVTSVCLRSADGSRSQSLTSKQIECVERLYRKHFGDSE